MIRPSVFIGSSSEGLPTAKAIRERLKDEAEITLWHEGVFGLGQGTLESLVNALDSFDFAILVLTPDDMVESRDQTWQSPRDNVLFECGLFMGRLGRDRTFIVYDKTCNIKLPSDLAGITLAAYGSKPQGSALSAAIEEACVPIRDEINKRGPFPSRKVFGIEIGAGLFKDVFGKDPFSSGAFHLIYSQLALLPELGERGLYGRFSFVKPGEDKPKSLFSAERIINSCEVRAAKYLAESIGSEAKASPALSSDLDMRDRLDVSFAALGGPASNYKTMDVITNDGNSLLSFDGTSFRSMRSGKIILRPDSQFEYGLLLKVCPTQFPERTWFTCAGRGEWGTSGTAWFLAKKWRSIQNYAKDSPFAIIVRVRPGQDESAEAVVKVRDESELADLEDSFDSA